MAGLYEFFTDPNFREAKLNQLRGMFGAANFEIPATWEPLSEKVKRPVLPSREVAGSRNQVLPTNNQAPYSNDYFSDPNLGLGVTSQTIPQASIPRPRQPAQGYGIGSYQPKRGSNEVGLREPMESDIVPMQRDFFAIPERQQPQTNVLPQYSGGSPLGTLPRDNLMIYTPENKGAWNQRYNTLMQADEAAGRIPKDWKPEMIRGSVRQGDNPNVDSIMQLYNAFSSVIPMAAPGQRGMQPAVHAKLFTEWVSDMMRKQGQTESADISGRWGLEREKTHGEYGLKQADLVGKYGLEGHRISAQPGLLNAETNAAELKLNREKFNEEKKYMGQKAIGLDALVKAYNSVGEFGGELSADEKSMKQTLGRMIQGQLRGGTQPGGQPPTAQEAFALIKRANPKATDQQIMDEVNKRYGQQK